jgi:hypothetical protein
MAWRGLLNRAVALIALALPCRKFHYPKGAGASNSTTDVLFPHNFKSKHRSSGPLDLGTEFGALSYERDSSKPAWVPLFNWEIPWTAETYKPTKALRPTLNKPGPVGNGVHRLTFGMATSKRIADLGLTGIDPMANRRGYIDPYMRFAYPLPLPQQGRAPRELVRTEAEPFGRIPSHEAAVDAGIEVVPIEDLVNSRKVALDFGLRSKFYSEGRNYTELTDPLDELTYTEQYLFVGGAFGVYAQAAEYIRIKAGFTAGYNTEHFLTNEDIGGDKNNSGDLLDPAEDPHPRKDVPEPLLPRQHRRRQMLAGVRRGGGQLPYDQVGFRFKSEGHVDVNRHITVMLTF